MNMIVFKSVNTVAKDFVKDISSLTQKVINKEEFLKKYGHLRQGTYDVNSKFILIILIII